MSAKTRLKGLLSRSDNRICADCSAPDPKWASANVGVFICMKCCGVHNSLGTHISKVLSVALDEWDSEEIDSMIEVGGNSSVNSIYESCIPEGRSKPGPDATYEERKSFIRSKYQLQEFMKPSLRMSSAMTSDSLQSSFSSTIFDHFQINTSKQSEDYIGLLKIKVVKGINLAIRDMRTSDPYVVLTLGQQTVKTAVISSNLNPVWDEELMLPVPQNYGSVKLEVFDHDMFSADDIMGDAELEIHPLITSAQAYGDPEMFSNMQIGKWVKSAENALRQDSIINIIDGKVKQDVELRLQNVECGELYLEMQWLSLDV